MPFIDLPDRPAPGLRAQARQQQPWYRFKNVAGEEVELLLYDEIGGWGTFADEFLAELKAITAPRLRVKVNSPGGSVFEGVALANALRAHPAEVTVQVDGIAASIASVIAVAADRVVMQPQSMLMVHDASGVCLGNAKDMAEMAALLDKISDNIADAYVAKAGGERAAWRQVMRTETWYTAEEAVTAGLADEVMPSRKQQPDEAEPEMRKSFDLAAYGYNGPAQAPSPKPKPPASQEPTTLTINIGSALDERLVEALRAAVAGSTQPASAEPVVEPAAEPETVAEVEAPLTNAAPVIEEPIPEPEPDPWTALTAHLVQPAPDPWAGLVAHLTSSSAATSTHA
jgi:ATP-dependent protease ClpP protease subunit